ncbi:MAG: phosphoribosylformylglycinamidine cyclo-ligase [Candidatus Omnitrophota bacterium]|nr:MAG: phosphoribosylformylglycinamidine cyclo-ligase [Candidatus Omnitrophota bacterium]
MKGLTYKKSGVDIEKANQFKTKLKSSLKKSYGSAVLKGVGGFGSLFDLSKIKYKDPILVSSADGVGTKLKIAFLVNKHDTVGIDAVAMNVNDILCVGAETLFFLDYIAFSKLDSDILVDVVKGVNEGCLEAGCVLIGGETAQMPGFYKDGDYDLSGFCVGIVERKNIIDGSKISLGDIVIGLESNGVHSNGYSLVRRVFSESELKSMSDELLKPTRIYVKPVISLLSALRRQPPIVKGIAHITGGAFYDKIARILPDNFNVTINKSAWNVPKIFRLIQNKGGIEDKEMYHTFNMGVGMVLIVAPEFAKGVISKLAESKVKSWVIGKVVKGKKQVEIA